MEQREEREVPEDAQITKRRSGRFQPASARTVGKFLTAVFSWSSSFHSVPEPLTAKPQTIDGEEVWPEFWGITRAQIGELLTRIRAEPSWTADNNVHILVHNYIIPWTRGTGLGYALTVNREAPREVNVMVSHAWSENAEEYLETLLRTCKSEDVLFVCALSLYQCEDGKGPSIAEQLGTESYESPFRRILEHILRRGRAAGWPWALRRALKVLPWLCLCAAAALFFLPLGIWDCMALSSVCAAYETGPDGSSSSWAWRPLPWWPVWTVLPACLLLLALCLNRVLHRCVYAGRMVVALNREVDIYSRLWCVYEIFVAKHLGIPVTTARSLAAAGKASVRLASCSSQEDTDRIRNEIVATTTYDAIDTAVSIASYKARWKVLLCSIGVGSAIAAFDIIFGLTLPLHPSRGSLLSLVPHNATFRGGVYGAWGFAALVIAGTSTGYFAMLSLFSVAQGVPSYQDVKRRAIVMMTVGTAVMIAVALLCLKDISGPIVSGTGIAGFIWQGYGAALWAYAWILLRFARLFRSGAALCGVVCYAFSVFLVAGIGHLYASGLIHREWDTPEIGAQLYRLCINSVAAAVGCIFLPTYVFWHTTRWWGFQVTTGPVKQGSGKGGCMSRGGDLEEPK